MKGERDNGNVLGIVVEVADIFSDFAKKRLTLRPVFGTKNKEAAGNGGWGRFLTETQELFHIVEGRFAGRLRAEEDCNQPVGRGDGKVKLVVFHISGKTALFKAHFDELQLFFTFEAGEKREGVSLSFFVLKFSKRLTHIDIFVVDLFIRETAIRLPELLSRLPFF